MRIAFLLVLLAGCGCAWADAPSDDPKPADADKPLPKDAYAGPDVVFKLGVESGKLDNQGRDNRIFTIPVACGDARTNFTWGCGGQTIISAWFGQRARIEVHPSEDLKAIVDGQGKPMFLGDASVELIIGGNTYRTTAWIMRDGTFNKNVPGVIGYEVARKFQWEIDPRVPQMTMRALGAAPKGKVLATLPLKEDQDNLWVKIKVRNVEDDVTLMPQSPDFQVSPALQKTWDANLGPQPDEIKTHLGSMRVFTMRGEDGIRFTPDIFETNFLVYLLEDNPNSRSGIGQSVLNRFVYSVDVSKKQMVLIERVAKAAK